MLWDGQGTGRAWIAVMLALWVAPTSARAGDDARSKLAVLPLQAKRVDREKVSILDELLVAALARSSTYAVMGTSDLNAVLGFERMKDAAGCDDVACAAEIGGALGVDALLAGSVSALGGELLVSLKLLDPRKSEVKSRGEARAPLDEKEWRGAIERAVADLLDGEGGGSSASAQVTQAAGDGADAKGQAKLSLRTPLDEPIAVRVWGAAGHIHTCTPALVKGSPCTLVNVAPGQGRIEVDGFVRGTAQVVVPPGIEVGDVEVVARPTLARITLLSAGGSFAGMGALLFGLGQSGSLRDSTQSTLRSMGVAIFSVGAATFLGGVLFTGYVPVFKGSAIPEDERSLLDDMLTFVAPTGDGAVVGVSAPY